MYAIFMTSGAMQVTSAAPVVKQRLVRSSSWGQPADWKPGSFAGRCRLLADASV